MSTRKKSKSGFTLIELLVAISLIAMVGLAIYGIFDSGIRVMQKIMRPVPAEELNIFFEKLSQDLQNAFRYSDVLFKGEHEKIVFAAQIQTAPELGAEQGIGRVMYGYDPRSKAVIRQQKNVSELYQEKEENEEESKIEGVAVLNRIFLLRFQYYVFVPEDRKYYWLDRWEEVEQKTGLPFALRIQIVFEEDGAKRQIVRSVTIPVAG